MFKDEAGGKQIAAFCGLRAKLYALKMDEGKEEKKCKGISKNVVKRDLNFEHYQSCHTTRTKKEAKMSVIRSHAHSMFSETITKIALSADDDKRIVLDDGVHTLAHGH